MCNRRQLAPKIFIKKLFGRGNTSLPLDYGNFSTKIPNTSAWYQPAWWHIYMLGPKPMMNSTFLSCPKTSGSVYYKVTLKLYKKWKKIFTRFWLSRKPGYRQIAWIIIFCHLHTSICVSGYVRYICIVEMRKGYFVHINR